MEFHVLYKSINTKSVIFIKDHQGMMVDPMFMIFQKSRLFLTDVNPNAVAPTAIFYGI